MTSSPFSLARRCVRGWSVARRQVTIFLSDDIAARVDEVRAHFDPESARRIRPHVTVVHDGPEGPLDDLALADLQRRVALVAREHPTFTLHLGAARPWGTAEAGIYLEVDDRDRALDALRRSLGVDGSGREFVPHVTLVHVRSVVAAAARDAWTALSGWQVDADVAVESISVIESDDGGGWRTVATFALLPDRAPAAVDRVAARVLVIDDDGALLLLQGCDPARLDRGTWWFTPGGGLDEGETSAAGARRELFEETGLAVDVLGEVVFHRVTRFDFEGVHYRQQEDFFCVRVPRFVIDDAGWSDVERRSVLGHRWWTPAELAGTDETIFPETIADLVRDILAR
jgi:8-oxo-dGTP pyrophosphatase MutT (NUDIX family)/2'-5' RNA ligase